MDNSNSSGSGCVVLIAVAVIVTLVMGGAATTVAPAGDTTYVYKILSENTVHVASDNEILSDAELWSDYSDNSVDASQTTVDASQVDNSTEETTVLYNVTNNVYYCVPSSIVQQGEGPIKAWVNNVIDSGEWMNHMPPC